MIISILFLSASLNTSAVYAEEEPIEFKNPEPYVDYEFEELQKTFLKNRKIQLATLKKLPLNQYPEEFLIELTNQVKREVKKEMQKELLDYLKRSIDKNRQALLAMPEKQESASRQTKGSPQFINPERKYTFLDKTPMQEINPGEKKGSGLKKSVTLPEKTKTQAQDEKKAEQKPSEEPKKTAKPLNRITVFALNSNASFLGINSLTKLNIRAEVAVAPETAFADVSIFIRNIGTDMIYMLRRFPITAVKDKKAFEFLWEFPSIPFGKYKPYVTVKFYDKNRRQIDELTQFWGNSSSPNMYILFKN